MIYSPIGVFALLAGVLVQVSEGDIGFAVLRGGDVAGEHSVVFYGEQESLSLTHKANSRTVFARGALRAARFAAAQAAPGLFTMDDVLEG